MASAHYYCSRGDLYDAGLPRGGVPNPGRPLVACDVVADTITLAQHGFEDDDLFELRALSGGTLPAPLTAATSYYAKPVSENALQIAATPGGPAIDLTSPGIPDRVALVPSLLGAIDAARAWASRRIDDMLPAGAVPLEDPIHELVRLTAAELAIGKILARTGGAPKPLSDMVADANKRLERWAAGVPIRGENAPTPTAVAQSASVPFRDARGWSRFGGLGGC